MHDAVDGGGSEMGVAEHRALFAELDVGGDDHAPRLVRRRHHLVQQPGPLDVYGDVVFVASKKSTKGTAVEILDRFGLGDLERVRFLGHQVKGERCSI